MNKASVTKTTQDVRDTLESRVQTSRERGADLLETAGQQIKQRSRKAGHFIEGRGKRVGESLETSASRVRGEGTFSPYRYVRRHPRQVLMVAGLGMAVGAALAMAMYIRNREAEPPTYFEVA